MSDSTVYGTRRWCIRDRSTGEEWDVEVRMDLNTVINQVARAATYNRTGRASLFGGRIRARVVAHRGASDEAPAAGRGRAEAPTEEGAAMSDSSACGEPEAHLTMAPDAITGELVHIHQFNGRRWCVECGWPWPEEIEHVR